MFSYLRPSLRIFAKLVVMSALLGNAAAQVSAPVPAPVPSQHPKYGPNGSPRAVPLSVDHAYFASASAPDFWALMPFYVGQMDHAACSAASVAMLVNAAIRAGRANSTYDQNISQQSLLDKVHAEHWKERVSAPGYQGRHGLNLVQLAAVCEQALQGFGVRGSKVSVFTADGTGEGLARFREVLAENERSARDAMLVHFVQDEVTAASGGPYPHISPIGAYDSARHRVLVLDVDRKWYEPYWVADEVLWRAMSRRTQYFGAGGWVFARFSE